jgi:tRNA pseudouridine38-40 synthase
MLPPDVVVSDAAEVSQSFNARRSKKKLYTYAIALGDVVPACVKRFVWHISFPVDLLSMKGAAKELVGRHDFSSFAVTDKRRKLLNPVRRIYSIKFRVGGLEEFFGGLGEGSRCKAVKIEFIGDGFLYKMIRSIVGTLVDIGRRGAGAGSMKKILSAASRSAAGRTAPPQGLTLVKVMY